MTSEVPVASPTPETTSNSFSLAALYREAWRIYKQQLVPLLTLLAIFIVFTFALSGGVMLLTRELLHLGHGVAVALAVVTELILLAASVVFKAAWLKAVTTPGPDKAPVVQVVRWGWRNFLPFLWLTILYTCLMIGGFMLLIVPGLIMMIWFSFSFFVLVETDERGWAALFRSRSYVRGHWWGVLGRGFLAGLPLVIVSIIPIVGLVAFFFYLPFVLTFSYAMFKSLREQAVNSTEAVVPGRAWWLYAGVAALGATLLVAGFVVSLLAPKQPAATTMTAANDPMVALHTMQFSLMLYAATHNGQYPAATSTAVPDPARYDYTPSADGTSYRLCLHGQTGSSSCVTDAPPHMATSTDTGSADYMRALFASSSVGTNTTGQ